MQAVDWRGRRLLPRNTAHSVSGARPRPLISRAARAANIRAPSQYRPNSSSSREDTKEQDRVPPLPCGDVIKV